MDRGLQRQWRRVYMVVAVLLGFGLWVVCAQAASAAPMTELESVSSSDAQGNYGSAGAVATPNGRWVVFSSVSTNLVTPAPMGYGDVYVRDRETGVTQLITQGMGGQGGDESSGYPQISNDGRYVAFASDADNLVAGVSGGVHVYRYDRSTGTLIALPWPPGEGAADYPSMSADGSEIAYDGYTSTTSGIIHIPSGNSHVYVWSAATGSTTEVDTTSAGVAGTGTTNDEVSLSADGSTVAFQTNSTNLTTGDTSGHVDVVEKNLSSGAVTLVSVGAGTQVNGDSSFPVVDGNGCVVAFDSKATNLVSGDTVSGTKVFDRGTCGGSTEIASVTDTGGSQVADSSNYGIAVISISDDGCLIAYTTPNGSGSNDDNAELRNRCKGYLTEIDLNAEGSTSTGGVVNVNICHGTGRYIGFSSAASDLVGNDTNGENDAFLRDTDTNVAPQAAVSTSVSGLSVTADASASSDPDGYVLTSSISWGDGSTPQNGVHGTHTYAQAGTYGVTVLVTDADGVSSTATSVVTVSAPTTPPASGSGGGVGTTSGGTGPGTGGTGTGGSDTGSGGAGGTTTPAVRLTGLHLSHTRFTTAKHGGSTLSLTLNTAATVKLTYARVQPGRRVKGSCRAHATKGPRCVRYVTVGSSSRSLAAGRQQIALTGLIGRRTLAPGTYRLTVTATAHGHTSTGHIQFAIVAVKRR